MSSIRFFQCFLFGAALLGVTSVFQRHSREMPGLLAQNTYLGPTEPGYNSESLIRIEIIVQDSPELGGVRILEASFDGHNIPIKSPDIYGHRGVASFQLMPGTYKLRWTVKRDAYIWPRTVQHEELVHVSPRDLWIQITVEGDNAAIR